MHSLLSNHRRAHERLDVPSVQDGRRGTGLQAVLACSRPQVRAAELHLPNRRLAPRRVRVTHGS